MKESFHYTIFTLLRVLTGQYRSYLNVSGNVTSITTSSLMAESGSLFVPLKGNKDGHQFIRDALERGASYFLCEDKHPILDTFTDAEKSKAIFVKDTLLALGKLAAYHRANYNPVVIAVTGSSGKTTTKEMLKTVFSHIDPSEVVITEKNYNNEIGLPFTIFKINSRTKLVIVEMGMNHRKEISRLSSIAKPDISIVTNVGSAHIEYLGSFKEIARAKAEILEGMCNGVIFLSEDNKFKNTFYKQARKYKTKVVVYGLTNSKILQISQTKRDGFLLDILGENLEWNLPGEKLLLNLSGVVSIAKYLQVELTQIVKNISTFVSPDKRLQVQQGYYTIIDDCYNANPESMRSSLSALKQISNGTNFYAILGDIKELGKFSTKLHKELGKFCKEIGLCGLITYGKDSKHILDEYQNPSLSYHFEIGNIDSMYETVRKVIPEGSTILVKGSRSMKMEEIVKRIVTAQPLAASQLL
jgi:UDP-N-acetylmuramoyl-tripeptide--D-alanyl-D-alanine ligase